MPNKPLIMASRLRQIATLVAALATPPITGCAKKGPASPAKAMKAVRDIDALQAADVASMCTPFDNNGDGIPDPNYARIMQPDAVTTVRDGLKKGAAGVGEDTTVQAMAYAVREKVVTDAMEQLHDIETTQGQRKATPGLQATRLEKTLHATLVGDHTAADFRTDIFNTWNAGLEWEAAFGPMMGPNGGGHTQETFKTLYGEQVDSVQAALSDQQAVRIGQSFRTTLGVDCSHLTAYVEEHKTLPLNSDAFKSETELVDPNKAVSFTLKGEKNLSEEDKQTPRETTGPADVRGAVITETPEAATALRGIQATVDRAYTQYGSNFGLPELGQPLATGINLVVKTGGATE